MFFYNYPVWQNAFMYQLIMLIIALIASKYLKFALLHTLFIFSCFAPVPIVKTAGGINGLLFMYDFFGMFIIARHFIKIEFSRKLPIELKTLIFLMLLWPIYSTLLASFTSEEQKITEIFFQIYRYLILFFYCFFAYEYSKYYLLRKEQLFKLITILVTCLSVLILLGLLNIIAIDVWWELKEYTVYDEFSLGKGAMFMYKAGIAEFSVFCAIISMYHIAISKSNLWKILSLFNILILILISLFSGSKQGIFYMFLALSILLFFYYRFFTAKNILLTILSFALVGLFTYEYFENLFVKINLSEYINDQFVQFFSQSTSKSDILLKDRNQQLKDFDVKFDSTSSYIIGKGLGGDRLITESDYINSFSYFGSIGLILYFNFIIRNYLSLKFISDVPLRKMIFTFFVIGILFGIQQWFILTWEPINGTNNLIFMFFLGLGISFKYKRK